MSVIRTFHLSELSQSHRVRISDFLLYRFSINSPYSAREKRARFRKINAFRSPFCRPVTFWLYVTSSTTRNTRAAGRTTVQFKVPLGRAFTYAVVRYSENVRYWKGPLPEVPLYYMELLVCKIFSIQLPSRENHRSWNSASEDS